MYVWWLEFLVMKLRMCMLMYVWCWLFISSTVQFRRALGSNARYVRPIGHLACLPLPLSDPHISLAFYHHLFGVTRGRIPKTFALLWAEVVVSFLWSQSRSLSSSDCLLFFTWLRLPGALFLRQDFIFSSIRIRTNAFSVFHLAPYDPPTCLGEPQRAIFLLVNPCVHFRFPFSPSMLWQCFAFSALIMFCLPCSNNVSPSVLW